jgi:hypothetical protein
MIDPKPIMYCSKPTNIRNLSIMRTGESTKKFRPALDGLTIHPALFKRAGSIFDPFAKVDRFLNLHHRDKLLLLRANLVKPNPS